MPSAIFSILENTSRSSKRAAVDRGHLAIRDYRDDQPGDDAAAEQGQHDDRCEALPIVAHSIHPLILAR